MMIKKLCASLAAVLILLTLFSCGKGGNKDNGKFTILEGDRYTLDLDTGMPEEIAAKKRMSRNYVQLPKTGANFELIVGEEDCMLVYTDNNFLFALYEDLNVFCETKIYYPAAECKLDGNNVKASFKQGYIRYTVSGPDVDEYKSRLFEDIIGSGIETDGYDDDKDAEHIEYMKEVICGDGEPVKEFIYADDDNNTYLELDVTLDANSGAAIPREFKYIRVSDNVPVLRVVSDERGRVLESIDILNGDKVLYEYEADDSYRVEVYGPQTANGEPFAEYVLSYNSDGRIVRREDYMVIGGGDVETVEIDISYDYSYSYENGILRVDAVDNRGNTGTSLYGNGEDYPPTWFKECSADGTYYYEEYPRIENERARKTIVYKDGIKKTTEYTLGGYEFIDRITFEENGQKEVLEMLESRSWCDTVTVYGSDGEVIKVAEYVYGDTLGFEALESIVVKDTDNNIVNRYVFEYSNIDSYENNRWAEYRVFDQNGVEVMVTDNVKVMDVSQYDEIYFRLQDFC